MTTTQPGAAAARGGPGAVTEHRPTVEVDVADWEQAQADLASLRARAQGQRTGTPAEAAELAHLREQNAALREVNVRLGRAEAENDQLNLAINALVGERDTARAEGKELGNEAARLRQQANAAKADRDAAIGQAKDAAEQARKLRQQLADCEAALVEANSARRLSNTEHLHQRLSAAALVIGRLRDRRYCPLCDEITEPSLARHACGPMVPVDVIIARRPKTTEEQP